MENTPNEVPAAAPAAESVTPTPNTNPTPAPAPDMHGFTSEELAGMRTFIENNGGWEKIKSRISNPNLTPTQMSESQNPTSQPQPQAQPVNTPEPYKAPEGSITAQEFLAQQYFQNLSHDPKYAAIAEGVANGEYLKEMSAFGIQPLNQDGSINDQRVRMYLDLKAQTVPAKGTSAEPDMSTAPTVDYIQATDGKITSMDQAFAILDQDMKLKAQGLAGNPQIALAEEYIRTGGKPAEKK